MAVWSQREPCGDSSRHVSNDRNRYSRDDEDPTNTTWTTARTTSTTLPSPTSPSPPLLLLTATSIATNSKRRRLRPVPLNSKRRTLIFTSLMAGISRIPWISWKSALRCACKPVGLHFRDLGWLCLVCDFRLQGVLLVWDGSGLVPSKLMSFLCRR